MRRILTFEFLQNNNARSGFTSAKKKKRDGFKSAKKKTRDGFRSAKMLAG
jgi:hypothetical protein